MTAIALVAAVCGTAQAARADAAPAGGTDLVAALGLFPTVAALPDSLGVQAPTLLHGRLTDRQGSPMSGAAVVLSAWPANESVHALPKGGEFDITPIARSVVGPDGSYELRAASPALPLGAIGRDGLDLQLDVVHNGRHWIQLTQVNLAGGGAWVRRLTEDALAAVPTLTAGARNALDLSFDRSGGVSLGDELLREVAAGRISASDHPFPGHWCTRYKKIDTKVVTETVATAISRNGAVGQVTYSHGAKTESSTGVSYDGGLGFSVSGSRERTSTLDAGWSPIQSARGAALERTYTIDWLHNILRQECLTDMHGGWTYGPAVLTEPDSVTGGANDLDSTRPVTWGCGENNRTSFASADVSTFHEQAATYEKAFSFAPTNAGRLVGSALSGYSDAIRVGFEFSHERPGRWCGNTGYPTANGQRVQGVAR